MQIALGDKFDTRSAIQILFDASPSYFAHRDLLYAGLLAWVLNPSEVGLRQLSIGAAASRCMAEAESTVFNYSDDLILSDFIIRGYILGPQFIEEIYYPLGGAQGLMDASKFYLDTVLVDSEPAIWTLVRVLRWFHFVCANFSGREEFFKPSVNKAVEIIEDHELGAMRDGRKVVGRSAFIEAWANRRSSIAFIYAASTIEIGEKTLLDEILRAEFKLEVGREYLRQWVGRARYVSDFILSKMPDPSAAKENSYALRSVTAESFDVPSLTTAEVKAVRSVFGRTASAKKSNENSE